jgi:hypothetical protein
MTPKIKNTGKWVGIGVAAIGGGGTVIAILIFALNAYIADAVNAKIVAELAKVPTIATVNNTHATMNDGISDNVASISELKVSQDEFRLLFIEYLQNEANR